MATFVTGMTLIAGLVLLLISGFRAASSPDGSGADGSGANGSGANGSGAKSRRKPAALLPPTLSTTTSGLAGLASIGRAIGDREPAGFPGKPAVSALARLDTAYYSPLCLFLGMTAIVVAARGHW